jgi:hypothetical protein
MQHAAQGDRGLGLGVVVATFKRQCVKSAERDEDNCTAAVCGQGRERIMC